MRPHEIPAEFKVQVKAKANAIDIFLNDEPAILKGEGPYAMVVQKDSRLGCEFAWQTALHVIENREGKFWS